MSTFYNFNIRKSQSSQLQTFQINGMNEITDFPYELQTFKTLRWSTNPRFKFCTQKHHSAPCFSDGQLFLFLSHNFSKFCSSNFLVLCTAASFGSKFLRWATLQVLESLQPPISMGSKQSTNTSLQTLQTNYCSAECIVWYRAVQYHKLTRESFNMQTN